MRAVCQKIKDRKRERSRARDIIEVFVSLFTFILLCLCIYIFVPSINTALPCCHWTSVSRGMHSCGGSGTRTTAQTAVRTLHTPFTPPSSSSGQRFKARKCGGCSRPLDTHTTPLGNNNKNIYIGGGGGRSYKKIAMRKIRVNKHKKSSLALFTSCRSCSNMSLELLPEGELLLLWLVGVLLLLLLSSNNRTSCRQATTPDGLSSP